MFEFLFTADFEESLKKLEKEVQLKTKLQTSHKFIPSRDWHPQSPRSHER